jgi:hypothetical protein
MMMYRMYQKNITIPTSFECAKCVIYMLQKKYNLDEKHNIFITPVLISETCTTIQQLHLLKYLNGMYN